ncbi:MAG: hypothetical protein LIP11_14585 [Clostridiales bacterium]|nr:hypothetical protein [Clostridiales bacterium]
MNGLSTAWISIGNLWTFGGLLLFMRDRPILGEPEILGDSGNKPDSVCDI